MLIGNLQVSVAIIRLSLTSRDDYTSIEVLLQWDLAVTLAMICNNTATTCKLSWVTLTFATAGALVGDRGFRRVVEIIE